MLDRVAREHALIDQLIAKYRHTPGTPPVTRSGRALLPNEPLTTLYTRLGTLQGERFRLLPFEPDESEVTELHRDPSSWEARSRSWVGSVQRVFALADGHVLALSRTGWVRMEASAIEPSALDDVTGLGHLGRQPGYCRTPAAEIPVVARSTEEILRWLLDPADPLPVIGTLDPLPPPVARRT